MSYPQTSVTSTAATYTTATSYATQLTYLTPATSRQNLEEIGFLEDIEPYVSRAEPMQRDAIPPVQATNVAEQEQQQVPTYPAYVPAGVPLDWQQVVWSQQQAIDAQRRMMEEQQKAINDLRQLCVQNNQIILQNNQLIGMLSQLVVRANRPVTPPLGKFRVERGESLDQFLRSFEEHCEAVYPGGGAERLRLLESHLEGDLLQVYYHTIKVNRDYQQVKVRLLKWYSDITEQTPLSAESAYQEAVMDPAESVGVYAMRLVDLARQANPGVEVQNLRSLRNKFLAGLREDLRQEAVRAVMITEKSEGAQLDWGRLVAIVEAYTAPLTAPQPPVSSSGVAAGGAAAAGDSFYKTPKYVDPNMQGTFRTANPAATSVGPQAQTNAPAQPVGVQPQVLPYQVYPPALPSWMAPVYMPPHTYAEAVAHAAPVSAGAVPKQRSSSGKRSAAGKTGGKKKDSPVKKNSGQSKGADKKNKEKNGRKPSSSSSGSSAGSPHKTQRK